MTHRHCMYPHTEPTHTTLSTIHSCTKHTHRCLDHGENLFWAQFTLVSGRAHVTVKLVWIKFGVISGGKEKEGGNPSPCQ